MEPKIKKYCKQLCLTFLALMPYLILMGQVQSSNLPEWFLKPDKYNSSIFAIGISNPGLESRAAFNQAKMRALLNYSILHQSNAVSLTSLSMGNQQNSPAQLDNIEYIIYTNILSGKIPELLNLNAMDSFYTQNKEAIVLLKIPAEINADSSKFSYTLTRRAAFQRDHSAFPIVIDELNFKMGRNDSIIENFYLEKDGSKLRNSSRKEVKNIFDNEPVNRQYYYGSKGIVMGVSPDNEMLPCSLNSGIWNSYLVNLVDQICVLNNFEQDLQYKLSTSNLGNSTSQLQNETYQQLVYALKNVQTVKLKFSIQKMGILDNQFFIGLKSSNEEQTGLNTISISSRADKKELKKLKSENWQVFQKPEFGNAWLEAKNMIANKDYSSSTIDIQANNLQSGILEAINLAKLELSSQLGSKINSLNNQQNSFDNQVYLNSSKLSNNQKTGKIGPYYIFYKKHYESVISIKVVLFYKLDQMN